VTNVPSSASACTGIEVASTSSKFANTYSRWVATQLPVTKDAQYGSPHSNPPFLSTNSRGKAGATDYDDSPQSWMSPLASLNHCHDDLENVDGPSQQYLGNKTSSSKCVSDLASDQASPLAPLRLHYDEREHQKSDDDASHSLAPSVAAPSQSYSDDDASLSIVSSVITPRVLSDGDSDASNPSVSSVNTPHIVPDSDYEASLSSVSSVSTPLVLSDSDSDASHPSVSSVVTPLVLSDSDSDASHPSVSSVVTPLVLSDSDNDAGQRSVSSVVTPLVLSDSDNDAGQRSVSSVVTPLVLSDSDNDAGQRSVSNGSVFSGFTPGPRTRTLEDGHQSSDIEGLGFDAGQRSVSNGSVFSGFTPGPRTRTLEDGHQSSEIEIDDYSATINGYPSDASHTDHALSVLRQKFSQLMKLPDIHNLMSPEYARADFDLEAEFDADSVVILFHTLPDMERLNRLVKVELKPATTISRPTHVRVHIKPKGDDFQPSYKGGRRPKYPIRLDQFPCFTAGTVSFEGGLTAHMSIHILDNGRTIGKRCAKEITQTWNAVFNLAKNNYRQTEVSKNPRFNEGKHLWNRFSGTIPQFEAIGQVRKKDRPATISQKPTILFVMHVMHEILSRIADGSWPLVPHNVNRCAAELLVDRSVIVIQSAGFKMNWSAMEETLELQNLPSAPKLKRSEHSIEKYHDYLQNGIAETYKRAFKFFFLPDPPIEHEQGSQDMEEDNDTCSSSTNSAQHEHMSSEDGEQQEHSNRCDRYQLGFRPSIYIDVAVVLRSSDHSINIFPNEKAPNCVCEASKARKNQIRMPETSLWPINQDRNQIASEAQPEDSFLDADSGDHLDEDTDEDTDEGTEEIVDRAYLLEELSYMKANNPTTSFLFDPDADDSNQGGSILDDNTSPHQEKTEAQKKLEQDERNFQHFFRMLEETMEATNVSRVRYALWGVAKRIGNAQNKPGCKQEVTMHFGKDENEYPTDQRFIQLKPHIERGIGGPRLAPIVQMYEPSTRAALLVQGRAYERWLSRAIPLLIAQYFSELEAIISDVTQSKSVEASIDVFTRIEDAIKILESWLSVFETEQTRVRYEFTIPYYFDELSGPNPSIPITKQMSPLSCISFAKRETLHQHFQRHIGWLKDGLYHGFCRLKHFEDEKSMVSDVSPEVWAMYVAMGEMLNASLGSGGGSVGSVLQLSTQRAQEVAASHPRKYYYYHDHMWGPYPAWIVFPPTPTNAIPFETKVEFGLDTSVLGLYGYQKIPQFPTGRPRDDLQLCLQYLKEMVPVCQIENIRKLHYPSQFRRSATLVYAAFMKAGNPDIDSRSGAFQRVDWGNLSWSRKKIEDLLVACSTILVSLSQFEWSQRIAKAYSRRPALQSHAFDVTQMANELESATTIHEIQAVFEHHLTPGWKDPLGKELTEAGKCSTQMPCNSSVITSLHSILHMIPIDDIFKAITGCDKDFVIGETIAEKQGWKNSGVQRLLLVLQELFAKVPHPPQDVLETFGNRNPFGLHDLENAKVFKHYVAATVQSLSESSVVVWYAPPAKLSYTPASIEEETNETRETMTKCRPVMYDVCNNRAQLSHQSGLVPPRLDLDAIIKDAFVNVFVTLADPYTYRSMHQELESQILSMEGLPKECYHTFQDTFRNLPDHPPSPAKIIFLQACLVGFFKYRGRGKSAWKLLFSNLDQLSNGFISHIYPQRDRLSGFQRKLVLSTKILDSLNDPRLLGLTTYQDLKCDVEQWFHPKFASPHLFNLAITMLRESPAIDQSSTILDNWKTAEELDPLQRHLHRIQTTCMSGSRPTREDLTKATIIASFFGILCPDYIKFIKRIRNRLREKIKSYNLAEGHDEKEQLNLACHSFVDSHCLHGHTSNSRFNFTIKNKN
jgi:hypothetical protein